ncbi:hypothetical protein [Acinetobacter sp. WZC-1]|uniref:hypothetical protein n=1 Tax=Acinetobacter sp. WZC-1 TaxID=3459034 RepID=UPI00403DC599
MRLQLRGLALMTGLSLLSISVFAEPAVQAGETLESLSKAKISTTVNGQPGSLQELVANGQVRIVSDNNAAAPAPQDIPAEQPAPADVPADTAQPADSTQTEQPSIN